jgi:hypothetical protein
MVVQYPGVPEQREFDALATMDQRIPHQQYLEKVELAIVLLEAPSNRLTDLASLVDQAKAGDVGNASG